MEMVHEAEESRKIPTKKILLWLAMVSMIMLFAGLTSAYVVRQAEGNWLEFQLPKVFTLSTIALFLSSISMWYATRSARKNQMKELKASLLITLGLGLLFVAFQFNGWQTLTSESVFLGGKYSNPAGSFLYVLTGLHVAHLIGGILYLMYVVLDATKNSQIFGAKNLLSVELCATFWHFLDGLWIYLFLFLYFVK